jgi:hypothetical protein
MVSDLPGRLTPPTLLISIPLTSVWCWGWDGAGDLEGPDVEPIWERMSNKSLTRDAVKMKHDRSFRGVSRGL